MHLHLHVAGSVAHGTQTCVVFWGPGRGEKAWTAAAVLAGDSGLVVSGEPPIGRDSTLAVSDLETSLGDQSPDSLGRGFEGLQVPRHWPICGRWDPQIVMDCPRRVLLLESLALP